MDDLDAAILRTVLYADVFDFPLTISELHHFLIANHAVDIGAVERALAQSARLRDRVGQAEGFVFLAGRADLVALRRGRERASAALWELALRYGGWLARLPFVRMVALTGALSMRNAQDGDDLDYLVVTAPGRVWLARAFSIALVRLVKRRGVVICPNYVLAETALAQEPQNLFIAHEIAQMIPIAGPPVYARLRAANPWTASLLPNAGEPFIRVGEARPGAWTVVKRAVECVLGGALGDRLERWEYRRKLARFAPDMATPGSAAQLDPAHVKGHFNDHGRRVLDAYGARIRSTKLYAVASEPNNNK